MPAQEWATLYLEAVAPTQRKKKPGQKLSISLWQRTQMAPGRPAPPATNSARQKEGTPLTNCPSWNCLPGLQEHCGGGPSWDVLSSSLGVASGLGFLFCAVFSLYSSPSLPDLRASQTRRGSGQLVPVDLACVTSCLRVPFESPVRSLLPTNSLRGELEGGGGEKGEEQPPETSTMAGCFFGAKAHHVPVLGGDSLLLHADPYLK